MDCYCGSAREYADCCEIAHNDISAVKTAEQLMRSRYTAFVMGNNELIQIGNLTNRPFFKRIQKLDLKHYPENHLRH